MAANPIDKPLGHSNPLRDPFKDRRDASRIERSTHLIPSN
jgi:hypothetical protein